MACKTRIKFLAKVCLCYTAIVWITLRNKKPKLTRHRIFSEVKWIFSIANLPPEAWTTRLYCLRSACIETIRRFIREQTVVSWIVLWFWHRTETIWRKTKQVLVKDQFRYIKIQPKTIDLRTRLWGINTEYVGLIPQSLVLRSIVLSWILINRNWSITVLRLRSSLSCTCVTLLSFYWHITCKTIFHRFQRDFKTIQES